jgi:hypothetical protein
MSMRTRNMVRYANALEKGIKLLILAPPISLHGYNFLIKHPFNKVLKITKALKHLRFMLNEIDPCKFAEIIYKTHIIFKPSDRLGCRTPYI